MGTDRITKRNHGGRIVFSAMAVIASLPASVMASAVTSQAHIYAFSIDSGTLQHALVAYAAMTGQQLVYSAEIVAHREVPTLRGRFTADEALEILLRGTNLRSRRLNPHLLILNAVTPISHLPVVGGGTTIAPPIQQTRAATPSIVFAPGSPGETSETHVEDEIVVIGSNIRGGGHGASPVQSFTQADMERNGYSTVAQALAALPANFGGTATEQSALAFVDGTGSNATLATGVNLRGLGANATLVLVNGHRLAGSGLMGDFSDVSSIPTGAVGRVEVLLDGASAIYGSDAVGGVVNIILKDHFDGAETRARFGSVTNGGAREWQIDQTIGKQWSNGGFMVSYEYDLRTPLASADRRFARSADLTSLGGTDHRYYLSLPGNILGVNPATGAFGPVYAIPGGQNGKALSPSDFEAGVVNLENFREGVDLTPRQERHSVYGVLSQDLSDHIHLSIDGRYSHRAFDAASIASATIGTITTANPWFVSPDGASSDLFAYSFGRELGASRNHGYAEALSTSGSVVADVGHTWQIRGYGGMAQERDFARTDNIVNDAFLSEALGTTPDDPSTGFSTANDGYFNPYGDGSSNSAAILSFVGSGYTVTRIFSRVYSGNIQADGPLLRLPGGMVRLAAGADIRREQFVTSGTDFIEDAFPDPLQRTGGSRFIEAAYAELHLPLVGAGNALTGIRSLDVSAAVRAEHYDDFGTTMNPKFGLTWSPVGGVALRATYGTSFRAPNLRELNESEAISTTTLERADGALVPVIQLSGGNPALKPETARSWTVGIDFSPKAVPGFQLNATVFRTVFQHRIDTPALAQFSEALTDGDLAPFVRGVSPATSAADLAYVASLLASPAATAGNSYPATAIGAVVDTRYVNTGKEDVSGLDLTMRYALAFGSSHFDLGANGSYLFRYRQQFTPTSASVDQLDLAGEPVHLKGRLTAGWSRGALGAQLGMNYVNHYRDLDGNRIGSWSTFDLSLSWQPTSDSRLLKGFAATLTAQNLFDRAPPFYDSRVGAGYDAANADAQGRYIALQLSKRW
ncbi:TonB-dependent receptor [Sphingomonas abietis]|uniref:TonB-dependent receptor n=1 Tax=Sphingomonas abietis TaxID=3012344 RepID=A0ABY7NTS7_9SPHN|nr:TonB-dependent receptor [Sphingomonas abietis]WBO24305.1 TonB-dependent receptor [Sphingomonas abietis]